MAIDMQVGNRLPSRSRASARSAPLLRFLNISRRWCVVLLLLRGASLVWQRLLRPRRGGSRGLGPTWVGSRKWNNTGFNQQFFGPVVVLVARVDWCDCDVLLRPILPCSLLGIALHSVAKNLAWPSVRSCYLIFAGSWLRWTSMRAPLLRICRRVRDELMRTRASYHLSYSYAFLSLLLLSLLSLFSLQFLYPGVVFCFSYFSLPLVELIEQKSIRSHSYKNSRLR